MRILVVNDDGPISKSSPYIYPFVRELQAAGHETSVVLPNFPRSWIGKAHIVESVLECSYYTPAPGSQEWVLVSGTPASCTQLGLYHLFQDLPPIDLVVSGPNWGRNATTIYNLSSGTVGGALEAALCRKKAIALSFASKDDQPPEVIAAAARIAVRLTERLYHKWGHGVELYNINVPMIPEVEACKILYTQALQSSWITGSLYKELGTNGHVNGVINGTLRGNSNGDSKSSKNSGDQQDDPERPHGELTNGHVNGSTNGNPESYSGCHSEPGGLARPAIAKRKFFKWAPQLADIARCVEESPPGTDAWAVKNGAISVTPLKANFLHVQGLTGSLEL